MDTQERQTGDALSRWAPKGIISKKLTTSGQPFPWNITMDHVMYILSLVTAQLLDATQMGMQKTHTHT